MASIIPQRPRGRAREWTEEEIERFIEDFDLEDADELAEEAGKRTNSLWTAGMILAIFGAIARKKYQSTIRWNAELQRFLTRANHSVARPELRRATFAVVKTTKQEVGRLSDQLKAGQLSISEFQLLARNAYVRGHVVSAGIAAGGRGQISGKTRTTIAEIATPDMQALARLMGQVERGEVSLTGRFNQRLNLLSNSVRSTFHQTEQVLHAEAGFVKARRVLGAADHCTDSAERDGCVELAAEGWVDIEDLVPIGDATCLDNCLCDVVYSTDDSKGEDQGADEIESIDDAIEEAE